MYKCKHIYAACRVWGLCKKIFSFQLVLFHAIFARLEIFQLVFCLNILFYWCLKTLFMERKCLFTMMQCARDKHREHSHICHSALKQIKGTSVLKVFLQVSAEIKPFRGMCIGGGGGGVWLCCTISPVILSHWFMTVRECPLNWCCRVYKYMYTHTYHVSFKMVGINKQFYVYIYINIYV